MSPTMKGWANIFTDSVAFDITYNILTNKSVNGHQIGIFFFSGFDANLRILPLALGLISK